jgi:hypothetical protein
MAELVSPTTTPGSAGISEILSLGPTGKATRPSSLTLDWQLVTSGGTALVLEYDPSTSMPFRVYITGLSDWAERIGGHARLVG